MLIRTTDAVSHTSCLNMNETLSEYVRRVMREKGLTFKDVEERSRNAVKIGTVSDIVQERTTNPTVSTLKALARGLGQTEEEVFAIARGESPEPMTLEKFVAELQALGVEDFNPAKGIRALTPADMEEILAVVRSTAQTMVEQKLKAKKKR